MAQPADVFISYSSKDVAHAEALEALLEKAGLTVWRDKKRLVPGEHYVFSIHDGIEERQARGWCSGRATRLRRTTCG